MHYALTRELYWVGMLAEVQLEPSIKVLKYMRTSVCALSVCLYLDSKEFHNIVMFGYCKVLRFCQCHIFLHQGHC